MTDTPNTNDDPGERTILVAMVVKNDRPFETIQEALGVEGPLREYWADGRIIEQWFAEDDATSAYHADNATAVFVHNGKQAEASRLLFEEGLTGKENVIGGTFEEIHA